MHYEKGTQLSCDICHPAIFPQDFLLITHYSHSFCFVCFFSHSFRKLAVFFSRLQWQTTRKKTSRGADRFSLHSFCMLVANVCQGHTEGKRRRKHCLSQSGLPSTKQSRSVKEEEEGQNRHRSVSVPYNYMLGEMMDMVIRKHFFWKGEMLEYKQTSKKICHDKYAVHFLLQSVLSCI